MNVVSGASKRKCVGTFCAADIEDYGWRSRQMSCKQLACTFGLEATPSVQSIAFETLGIVGADIRFKLHTPQLSRHSVSVNPGAAWSAPQLGTGRFGAIWDKSACFF
jgi:hypothetical protein